MTLKSAKISPGAQEPCPACPGSGCGGDPPRVRAGIGTPAPAAADGAHGSRARSWYRRDALVNKDMTCPPRAYVPVGRNR